MASSHQARSPSPPVSDCRKAILQTIVYSDIFAYPLTRDELWHFLKTKQPARKKDFVQALHHLTPTILDKNGYYFLRGRDAILNQRASREKSSKPKLIIASRIAKKLSFIPTISFIGISGSLALSQASADDDIDLFIIVNAHTVWVSRLFILSLLALSGVRRKRMARETANKICTNMILDEQALQFSPSRHDTYTAHEIVQLKPLFNRNGCYQRFLSANNWVKNFMPNALEQTGKEIKIEKTSGNWLFSIFEHIIKKIQIAKINKTRTTETVTDTLLAFHPSDNRKKIMAEYEKRVRKYSFA